MFGLVEEPLHLLTQLVLLPVMGKPLGAVRPGGNHGFNAPVCRLCGVGIAGLVHDHRSRFGAVFQLRPQQLEAPGVMLLPYLRFFRAYLSMSDNDNAGTTPCGCPSSGQARPGQARGPVPTDAGAGCRPGAGCPARSIQSATRILMTTLLKTVAGRASTMLPGMDGPVSERAGCRATS